MQRLTGVCLMTELSLTFSTHYEKISSTFVCVDLNNFTAFVCHIRRDSVFVYLSCLIYRILFDMLVRYIKGLCFWFSV